MKDYTTAKAELLEEWFAFKKDQPFSLDELALLIQQACSLGEEFADWEEAHELR